MGLNKIFKTFWMGCWEVKRWVLRSQQFHQIQDGAADLSADHAACISGRRDFVADFHLHDFGGSAGSAPIIWRKNQSGLSHTIGSHTEPYRMAAMATDLDWRSQQNILSQREASRFTSRSVGTSTLNTDEQHPGSEALRSSAMTMATYHGSISTSSSSTERLLNLLH